VGLTREALHMRLSRSKGQRSRSKGHAIW